MIKLTVSEFAKIVDGKSFNLDLAEDINQIPVINSKEANPNTFFVAFVGENQDGHLFVDEAIKKSEKPVQLFAGVK